MRASTSTCVAGAVSCCGSPDGRGRCLSHNVAQLKLRLLRLQVQLEWRLQLLGPGHVLIARNRVALDFVAPLNATHTHAHTHIFYFEWLRQTQKRPHTKKWQLIEFVQKVLRAFQRQRHENLTVCACARMCVCACACVG